MAIDMKQFSQPYVGDEAAMADFLWPARTTAQIADVGDLINTKDKFVGKHVYDATLDLDYIANGSAAADTWTLNDGLGLTAVTPS